MFQQLEATQTTKALKVEHAKQKKLEAIQTWKALKVEHAKQKARQAREANPELVRLRALASKTPKAKAAHEAADVMRRLIVATQRKNQLAPSNCQGGKQAGAA